MLRTLFRFNGGIIFVEKVVCFYISRKYPHFQPLPPPPPPPHTHTKKKGLKFPGGVDDQRVTHLKFKN